MKKLLSVLLAVLTCFCFTGCDAVNKLLGDILRWGATVPPSAKPNPITYIGVVESQEETDALFVYIDGVGLCDIPTYEKGTVEVVEGDLLLIEFYTDEVAIMECYPARFASPADYVGVVDFSFSLTWGIFGHSSYDSETGRLVKTDDVSPNDDYVATHFLTPQEKLAIYKTVRALEITSYSDEFNPTMNGSDPYETLVLSARIGNISKTITAKEVGLNSPASSTKGREFMDACETISDILESTEEWKAMPDFPFYYE